MRSISGARNRAVLALTGLLALIIGGWLGASHFDLAQQWPPAAPLLPERTQTLAGMTAGSWGWLLPLFAVLAAAAVIAGLMLLVSQVPTQPTSSRLRLTETDGAVLASVDPDVLERALSEHAEQISGVLDADVRVSGTARTLWLQASVTIADQAEVEWSIEQVRARLSDDVSESLGHAPRQVDLLVQLRSPASRSSSVAITDPAARPAAAD